MKAVQYLGNSKVMVKDYPDPKADGNKVLIQVKASGVCGSELHAYRGPKEHASNGGHEVAGVVVDAGTSKKLKAGDRVGVHSVWGCGNCRWCAMGQYTYCDTRSGLGGAHAELITAPDHCCLKLPDDVPDDVGVLLSGDGLGVPYHVSRRLGTRPRDFVLVIGAGPIGLGNILVQSYLGAEVIACDITAQRLQLAKDLGAAHAIDASKADPLKAVKDLTHGMLCERVIEAVGRPETFALAMKAVGKAGTVMLVGEQGQVPLSPSEHLIRRDITLMGSWFYHFCEFWPMLDLYRRGLRVAALITDRFPLAQANEAYAKFASGLTGKVMLVP